MILVKIRGYEDVFAPKKSGWIPFTLIPSSEYDTIIRAFEADRIPVGFDSAYDKEGRETDTQVLYTMPDYLIDNGEENAWGTKKPDLE